MSSEYNLRYWTHAHDAYQLLPLKQIIKLKSQTLLWSARIGTGLLGLTDCSSGKRGPKNYANKKIVGFDALRLDWETILNITKRPPSRIYTSPKPDQNLLSKTIDAFLALSIPLPPIGFYNRTAPGNFTEIDIGHS